MAGNFKIYIRKQEGECSNVEVWINTGANTEHPWYAPTINLGSAIAAEFVAKELNQRLHNLMEEVRRHAYELGWNDAKKRRKKADCFPSMCEKTWFENKE